MSNEGLLSDVSLIVPVAPGDDAWRTLLADLAPFHGELLVVGTTPEPLDFAELWMRLRVAERILRYTTQVRQLEQMLPICSYCKKIRDDRNYWQQIEGYISERTGSDFSHSVCPECYERVVVPQIEQFKAGLEKRPPSVERES